MISAAQRVTPERVNAAGQRMRELRGYKTCPDHNQSIQTGASTISATALERRGCLRYGLHRMLDMFLGCLKWAAVGFVVAFTLMKLFEASHIHDDIPKPAFKIRQSKRATLVLSTFAAMLSALVWLLVQKLD